MKITVLLGAVIVAALVWFFRYDLQVVTTGGQGSIAVAYVLNRITGDVYFAGPTVLRALKLEGPSQPDAFVPPEVLAAITGGAEIDSNDEFSGYIYNGDDQHTITEITVALAPKRSIENTSAPRRYNIYLTVLPLTSSHFSVRAHGIKEKNVDWSITKARGHIRLR